MLKAYQGALTPVNFAVYDLEWYPDTMKLRLVGLFDGSKYESFTNVLEFLQSVLTSDNRGKVFFAHAGGLADVQFILETILRRNNPSLRVEASFSGSSAIIVRVTLGKNSWVFADSYWLLRDSLKKIGKSLGEEKGGEDYFCSNFPHCGHRVDEYDRLKAPCIFYAPLGVLTDYNRIDCRILYWAIRRFEDEILALGGSLRMTVASTAMRLFRAQFLKDEFPTSAKINEIARLAYIASRVEVFEARCGPANYYDINSSFPSSMLQPLPGALLGSSKAWREGDDLALVLALIEVPKGTKIPPLPMRLGEGGTTRVYFPTGKWKQWFSGIDLLLLLEMGGRILKVFRTMRFAPFRDMGPYVETLYGMRRRETDEFRRLVLKYLLNSLYGKFAETTEKEELLINPAERPDPSTSRQLRPGVYLNQKTVTIEHEHVPFSMAITARSRALITRPIAKASDAYYCDTDALITTDTLPTPHADDCPATPEKPCPGCELGQLKLETRIQKNGRFLAPKLYRIDDKVRAKGFPKLKPSEFDNLANGDPVVLRRMIRIRELYQMGELSPRDANYEKRAQQVVRPKREFLPDGSTRPWDTSELVEAPRKR